MSMRSVARNGGQSVPRWRLKPHHQIAVVMVVALVALAIAAVVASERLTQINDDSVLVTRHSAVSNTLSKAELLYEVDNTEVSQILAATSSAGRAVGISVLAADSQAADAAWATYKRTATGVGGEATLQKTAEDAEAQQITLVAPVLTGRTPPPGIAAAASRVGAAQISAMDALRAFYAAKANDAATVTAAAIADSRHDLLITASLELVFLLLTFSATYASVRRRDRQFHANETERDLESDRNDLETRVARSLEMVHTEPDAYVRVARAIAEVAPNQRAQVLVADSSRAHLHQTIALNLPTANSGCPVGTPGDCPAITHGQTQTFAISDALDACPYLADRPEGACSATCVPMSIGGESIGVVHLIAEPNAAVDTETTTRLELIARKAGDRIGMLRAFTRSETEARTDQLTGLLNRRSLESEVRQLADAGQPYTVAYGDLDHFKQLNDVYGHDAGDRALRLFARVLRDSVRPRDIPARYGGEEFVVVLPDCTLGDATQVLERVRENLHRTQTTTPGPPFTVSFGISNLDSNSDTNFDEMLKSADQALSTAKEQGRDQIITTNAPARPS